MGKRLMKSDEMSSHRCYEVVRMIRQQKKKKKKKRSSWMRLR
jgi:hypothetical protein